LEFGVWSLEFGVCGRSGFVNFLLSDYRLPITDYAC